MMSKKATPAPTCTRRIEFDAAHRVMNHESKCKNLHGHRYVIEATFAAQGAAELDNLGRVIDFGVVREVLGTWVDNNWDHATILFDKDKALGKAIADVTGQKIFYLSANPTAENMAAYLLRDICPPLFASHGVSCTRLRLYETPNCYAEIEI
jgi:6-pyruvoyltetrahydropterin/6-carboxytetrahydropterin synthase